MVKVKDFGSPFKTIDGTTGERFNNYTELKDAINHQDATKIHRKRHEKALKTYSFHVYNRVHSTPNHKTTSTNLQELKPYKAVFSTHSGIKLVISNGKRIGKSQNAKWI